MKKNKKIFTGCPHLPTAIGLLGILKVMKEWQQFRPHQTAPKSSLIWVNTAYSDLSFQIFRVNTEYSVRMLTFLPSVFWNIIILKVMKEWQQFRPHQTAPKSSLIWVNTAYSDLSFQIFRVNTEYSVRMLTFLPSVFWNIIIFTCSAVLWAGVIGWESGTICNK